MREPHLIVISGPLRGTIFSLDQDEVSIGRDASNSICLNDLSISRQHGRITRTTEPGTGEQRSFVITDLESYNGTFLNGRPITEQLLTHGDQVTLGDVQFLFFTERTDSSHAEAGTAEEKLITRSTLKLRREDALYLDPERVSAELPANSRVAEDLNTLFRVATTVNSIRNFNELQHRLLELIRKAFGAERQAILMLDQTGEAFEAAYGWTPKTGPDKSITVSRTVTNQVVQEKIALLSNDVVENDALSESPSLVASRVCSLLCVPLMTFEEMLGVIYLDTSVPSARFDEGHLQLLTAIAGTAAVALQNARQFERLEERNARLSKEILIQHAMIGQSVPMQRVYAFIAKVANTQSTVLIRGESGTGKELAAHAVHTNSLRAAKPFLAINCATLTETLLESELFGHEKGAFTGAINQKRGKLEVAAGGTIFLDEVGELAPSVQAKLLRVLETREFERVGGTRTIKVDVRIICATHRDLEEMIKGGNFRDDLYYRLNVISIVMPPLRERRDDIPLLATYFVNEYSRKCKRKVRGISPEVRRLLQAYEWPGNVRELENTIERAIVLGSTDLIVPEDLPDLMLEAGLTADPSSPDYYQAIKDAKRKLISNTLRQTNGNYTEAAKLLGIHPNNLHRLIRNLGLKSK